MTTGDHRSPYLVGPIYDWAFFLLPPVGALFIGILISGTRFSTDAITLFGMREPAAGFLIGTVIHAHLVAVVFRSHGNSDIFRLYPRRFVLVPVLLWMAIYASVTVAVLATVVATFWDVWHSGAQTFGFARIYDRNAGVPPESGRRLDFWLNQLLYAGPILAGVSLADHIGVVGDVGEVGPALFADVPAFVEGHQRYLTWTILAGGTGFVLYYVWHAWRRHRMGHHQSFAKVFLVASTGFCSIYTWGFNTWGEAFFIMNLFHAVQYLGLVWHTEKRGIIRRLRVQNRRGGAAIALMVFVASVMAYGFGAEVLDPDISSLWAVTMVVSLMHFWYDAFIWSVRKRQI